MMERYPAPARAAVTDQAWAAELAAGRTLTQAEAVTLLPRPARHTIWFVAALIGSAWHARRFLVAVRD